MGVTRCGRRYAICSSFAGELLSDVMCIVQSFLLSTDSPLLFCHSTLSLAATFCVVAADFMFAYANDAAVVQIRDGAVSSCNLVPRSGLHHFPPWSSMNDPLTFVVVDLRLLRALSAQEAVAKALSGVREPMHCVAILVDEGRVCAFAQRFWDGASLGWRQTFQPMPEDGGILADAEFDGIVMLKRSK